MMKANKQNWILGFAASAAMVFALPVWANNGYILKKGKEYPLCREMIEILNLPENAHSLSNRRFSKEFTIPKKYKNFQSIDWRKLTEEEISKYITPSTLQALDHIKDRALHAEKDWDGKGDFLFEVAQVYFDSDDTSLETVLRYRLPNWKQWNCMFADTEPEDYRNALHPQTTSKGFQCTLMSYGRNIFLANGGALTFIIDKPLTVKFNKKSKEGYDLGFDTICEIQNPNWKPEPYWQHENSQPKGISK
jgi:hypothetical protein